ncbi:MAG: VWA domain-containing protein [Sinobacteraceae bacterium]|nr:VWA domain-containing protein [Nevskiaceae bacterium]MCP5339939.1 VWA domain-containing protein [Nevskiaceae bacterium]MCP5471028.1 VWA domain-containing protein [Nevskiaceae bacterium]
MKLRRRDTEVFSLSFLDVICCGFGAIILLLVLSEFGQPVQIEKSRENLSQQLERLQEELFVIRGDTTRLERELEGRVERLTRERLNLARTAGEASSIRGQFDASQRDAAVSSIVERELLAAYDELQAEQQRLLKASRSRRPLRTDAVGGIPVDSDYVIFLIDTSGSMQGNHWETAQEVMKEILDIYPRLKGLQIVDDNGKEMFEGTRGRWLTDSPSQRTQIVNRMRNWRTFSDSSPADGIEVAIRNYWSADKRISIYVLGDEFTGESIQGALDAVDRINRPDGSGRRRVRIHAIGFPVGGGMTPFTNIRFSALMRAMCERNDGTFVGLTNVRICTATIEINGVRQCVGGN